MAKEKKAAPEAPKTKPMKKQIKIAKLTLEQSVDKNHVLRRHGVILQKEYTMRDAGDYVIIEQ